MSFIVPMVSLLVYFLIGSLVAEADRKVCEDQCKSYYMFLMILWPIVVVSIVLVCIVGVIMNIIEYFR